MPKATRKRFQVEQPERRSLLTRHLLGAVEPLLADGSRYADLSVEQIIRAAGISRSTFYAYYADKGAALEAMASHVVNELLPVGESWWQLPPTAGRAQLREALRGPIGTYRAHRAIFDALVETAPHDPRIRSQQQRLVDQVIGALAAHIADGQRTATIAPELDPQGTARWLIWMIERGLYQFLGAAPDAEAERILEVLTGCVWRVLYEGCRAAD